MTWDFPISARTAARSLRPASTRWRRMAFVSRSSITPVAAAPPGHPLYREPPPAPPAPSPAPAEPAPSPAPAVTPPAYDAAMPVIPETVDIEEITESGY